jgi:hypothetical protein
MSFHMPITKRKVSHHFQYSVWMYLVLAALALFGWNLLYTTTRYRPPEDMQVEFYVQSSIASEDDLTALADRIHEEIMPEMELVTALPMTISSDYYGDMQLTVWISAAQGDVYLLSNDYFTTFAASGAFMDLEPLVESGQLDIEGIDLSSGYVRQTDIDTDTASEIVGLYGIPADSLTGFADYLVGTEDMTLCILYNNGNDDYSVMFLNYLLTHLR